MSVLETKKITKNFNGVKAVSDLSVGFNAGEITGLIGPNGSGKTTLVNLLSGILPIDGGAVVIGGANIKSLEPFEVINYGVTRTFQEVRLFNQMSVLDNILIALTERGVLGALVEKHTEYHQNVAKEILTKVGLWNKRAELAVNLSYGQRKLLEIGRALSTRAQIYFFDEPFAGLFPEMRALVSKLILALKSEGNAVVLIEHSMDLIRALCDQVYVLDSGELLASGAPGEVLKDKKVIDAYLGK